MMSVRTASFSSSSRSSRGFTKIFLSLLTMALKTIKAFRPQILGSERVPLSDLSVAEDSGWREEDGERVDQLIEMIKDMPYLGLAFNGLEARCKIP